MAYVDCDSHILPDDAFTDVAPDFERQKPRIVTDTEGNSFVLYEARQKKHPGIFSSHSESFCAETSSGRE